MRGPTPHVFDLLLNHFDLSARQAVVSSAILRISGALLRSLRLRSRGTLHRHRRNVDFSRLVEPQDNAQPPFPHGSMCTVLFVLGFRSASGNGKNSCAAIQHSISRGICVSTFSYINQTSPFKLPGKGNSSNTLAAACAPFSGFVNTAVAQNFTIPLRCSSRAWRQSGSVSSAILNIGAVRK